MAGGIRDVLALQFLFGFGFGVLAPPQPEIVQETFTIARVELSPLSIAQTPEATFAIARTEEKALSISTLFKQDMSVSRVAQVTLEISSLRATEFER